MVFSSEHEIFIKNLVLLKGYSSRRLIKEFPQKGWNKNGLDVLLRKIRKTDRQPGSGRPRSVRIPENIDAVNDLVLSQEGAPQAHRRTRQIQREIGMSKETVYRIIHDDLQLKCMRKRGAQLSSTCNTDSRLERYKQLLWKFPEHMVPFIWFTAEHVLRKIHHCTFGRKIFSTTFFRILPQNFTFYSSKILIKF